MEVGVSPELEKKLAEIKEELSMETYRSTGKSDKEKVERAIRESIDSIGLNFIRENLDEFGIRQELFDMIIAALAKLAMSKDEERK